MLIKGRQGGSPNRRLSKKQRYTPLRPARPANLAITPVNNKPPTQAAPHPIAAKPPTPHPNVPAPVTQQSATMRANADQALQLAKTGYLDSAYRAAMNLGDPAVLAKLSANPQFAGYQFTQDPNSAFSSLARDETQGLLDTDTASNANNAFFSGYRLQDRSKLSDDVARQRLGASTSYEDALKAYASTLGGAQGDWNSAYSDADQYDIDAALALDPVNQTPTKTKPAKPPTTGANTNSGSGSTKKKKKPKKKSSKQQVYTPQKTKKPKKLITRA